MIKSVRIYLSVLFAMSTFLGCQPSPTPLHFDEQNQALSSASFEFPHSQPIFKVISEDGLPILAARVLIGMQVSHPFLQNLLTTDSEGQFLPHELWVDPQPVTIEAPGFVRATYFETDPKQAQTFILRRKVAPRFEFELSGVATGFQVKNRDRFVDFGLTIPVVKPEDLFQFNLDMILSPYTDTMTVIGQEVQVPSNVTLPQQRESYILPVTLEKPNFKLGFVEGGTKHLISLAGTFPIKPVFDAFRNGDSFADVINAFDIKGLSLHQVNLTQKNQRMDLPMNQNIIAQSRRVRASVFNQNNEVVLGVSIATHPHGLFPVDVKRLTSNQFQALKIFGREQRALSILRFKDEFDGRVRSERLSASLEAWTHDGQELSFLPLLKDPVVKSTHELNLHLVPAPDGYYESGALYKMSSIRQVKDRSGAVISEEKSLFWEAYSPKWSNKVEFPRFPGQAFPVGHKRWSASLFASKAAIFRVRSINTLTQGVVSHVTHANADFQ